MSDELAIPAETAETARLENGETDEHSPLTVIEPRSGWFDFNFAEIWQYRELLFFLAWRDIKVRYKQTVLGAAWAILQPLAMMLVFTVVMGRMAGVPTTTGVPQPIFFFAGVLLWNFFATAVAAAAGSVVQSNTMVEKVYFPRIVIPFSSVGAAAVDFVIAFGVLLVMMIGYGVAPRIEVLLVPVLLCLAALAALGVGSLLAALNVAYRDFRYTIPFMVQLWMFATPSIYMDVQAAGNPSASGAAERTAEESTVGHNEDAERQRTFSRVGGWLELNPLTGLIASFRAAVLGSPVPWPSLAYSAIAIFFLFVLGTVYFNRAQRSFADVI